MLLRWDLGPHVKEMVQVHEYRMAGGSSSFQDFSIIPFSLFLYLCPLAQNGACLLEMPCNSIGNTHSELRREKVKGETYLLIGAAISYAIFSPLKKQL